jgi:transcriptional regulator with XRE-family HTH domain
MPDGPTLASLRTLAGFSQDAIADRLGISGPAVGQMEKRDYVRSDTARKFQKAILTAVQERAIGGLIADTMKALVTNL